MRALIICAAPVEDFGYINELAGKADKVICADGGLKYALACSVHPDIVIGDFDSYEGKLPENVPYVRLDTHKDDTDTICCINRAISFGCDEIVLACALGGRVDHTLANIASLDYMAEKGVRGEIVSSKEKILLLTEGSYIFENKHGKTFSLFAFNCEDCTVSYKNAEYPLDRQRISAAYPKGISNVFTDDTAGITVHNGKAVLIINEVL